MQLQPPAGEACAKCGATMAGDQRYCIECGERRGDPRFTLGPGGAPATTEPQPVQQLQPAYPMSPTPAQRNRWSSGLALVSGVGVLLLAMGVGVLIGNNGSGTSGTPTSQPVVLGGAVTAQTGATKETAAAKKEEAAPTESDSASAEATAKANGVELAKPDVGLGDKCEKGTAGCEDGEFTGDFFE